MKKISIYLAILLLLSLSCSNSTDNNDQVIIEPPLGIEFLELPKELNENVIIKHSAYAFSYNEDHEQANWVAYQLKATELIENFERSNDYRVDPNVITGTANDDDYSGSGYDRGHLAPAEDFSWDETAMSESFYYSNMSPQNGSFNRGKWKSLENDVRRWAIEFDSVWIITGPIFNDPIGSIGTNSVTVPSNYFKAILTPDYEGIAFILPNMKLDQEPEEYVVTIDSIESVIGYDLFYQLEDSQEAVTESSINYGVFYK